MTVRVFVVDDSAVVRQALAHMLSGNAEVELVGSAPNPLLAMDMIRKNPPDVLLLDIEMPGMDGLTALRELRANPQTHGLTVVALTALAMTAFAGNSLLCRIALKHTSLDAASFTAIRLFSGALVLWLVARRWRSAQSGAGSWPSALALFAPYVNSYRRLSRFTAAPINIQWGTDNRTVGIRSPVASPAARRIENRVIGADANPYVALAATLACGYLGIKNQIEPTPECKGDAYLGDYQLPRSLGEALEKLRNEKALAEADNTAAAIAARIAGDFGGLPG